MDYRLRTRVARVMISSGRALRAGELGKRHCDSEVQDDYTIHSFGKDQRIWIFGENAVHQHWRGVYFWLVSPRLLVSHHAYATGLYVIAPEGEEHPFVWPSSRGREQGFYVRGGEAIDVTGKDGPWLAEVAERIGDLEAEIIARARQVYEA